MEILRKLAFLFRRRRYTDDLAEEMAFHREQAARDLEEDGSSADDARYAVARQFGNATRLREESVDAVAFRWETAWQDLRYALRQLRKNPGFAATAIIILALGIGATTAIFSAIDPILLEPLPYPGASQLVSIFEHDRTGKPGLINFGDYVGLTERSRSFDALAAFKAWQPTMTGADQPERLEGLRVNASFLRVFGVTPALGRDLQAADDQYRGPNVVILGHKLWRRRFGSDPTIVGREVKLNDDSFLVIGVMPENFENVLAPDAQLYAPLQYNRALPPNSREWGHHLRFAGRVKPGITRAQAAGELNVLAPILAQQYAAGYSEAGGAPAGYTVVKMQDDVAGGATPALLAVMGAVLLVLVIACVNVTNLLLARAAQRRGEFAMRAALGAARSRLLRQLVTESLALALLGGIFGLAVAEGGVRALVAMSPQDLPRAAAIHLNPTVFIFALAITAVVGIVVGLVPAWQASRSDPQSGMQLTSQRTAGRNPRTRRVLVVAEVGLALVLLVSAGLLLRSLQRLFSVEAGFNPSGVLTMQVQESGLRYRDDAARVRFFQDALERVRQVPGVVAAGFTSQLPLSGDLDTYGAVFEKDWRDPTGARKQNKAFLRYSVTPGYLEAMQIPLLRGRLLNEHDTSAAAHYCFNPNLCGAAPAAVLINQSFAQKEFGAQDPIGQRVRMGPAMFADDAPWATIVGVVGNVKQSSLAITDETAIYVPSTQWFWGDQEMSLVVRSHADPATLVPALRSAIWSVDKDQPIVRIATMEKLMQESEAQRRFAMFIFEAFALVALILAATGIYGVLAGSVSERTREIGVRAALGASRSRILGLIVRQGMSMTSIGLLLGLLGAGFASRALITMLFGISRLDPLTYVGVAGLLLAVALIACSVPAWRAAGIDPAITLRTE